MALPYRGTRSASKPPLGFADFRHPIYNGLVAAYLLNEGGGLTLFDTARSQQAALSGTLNWSGGPQGPAINFNGGGAAGPAGSFDPYTFAFWANFSTASPSHQAIVAKSDGATAFGTLAPNHGWVIEVNAGSGGVYFYAATSAGVARLYVAAGSALNSWHFYVVFWDQTGKMVNPNAGIYVDGILASTTSVSAIGTYASDGGYPLSIGIYNGATNPCSNAQISSIMAWNRILSSEEAQELYVASYPSIQPRYPSKPAPFPSQDYLFYDSFPYSWAAQQKQAAFQRNGTFDAFWVEVAPTIGVPTFSYAFDDRTDYRQAPLRAARFPRDQVAFTDIAPITTTVPHQDYLFYDSFDYRAAAMRAQQAHFDRTAILANFQATIPPSFDWPFYDSFDYKARQSRLVHFARDYVADAGIIFAATGPATAPKFGYLFYDSFDYKARQLRHAGFPRDYVANTAALFTPVGLTVPSQDYIFYDSNDYVGRARQAAQRAFQRNYIAEPPWSALVIPPFLDPAGWYPITTPISVPVRVRQSYFDIGVPNDIRDGTRLPAWNFLQIGDSSQEPLRQRELFRRLQQNVDPVKPPKTFLSQWFTATWAPWSASLSKAATRNFRATFAAWVGSLSVRSPRPPVIVGFALNVCSESRILAAIKYTLATVCQDPRTVTVPLNTTPVCMTFVKDPQATTDYSIDWTAPLTAAADTIKTSSWATDPGVAIAKSTYTGAVATAFVSGGTTGSSYSVTNTITTPGGRTLAQNFIVKVQLR